MDRPLRVAIAEDHNVVREGTRRALHETAGIEVAAAVGTAIELDQVVDRELSDVVMIDIRMPPDPNTEGIDAAHRIGRTPTRRRYRLAAVRRGDRWHGPAERRHVRAGVRAHGTDR